MTDYFISDTHFAHKNIIKYSNRPFKSVEEMDEAMIENWNNTVKPNDDVWHLGDFSFHRDVHAAENVLRRLRGNKHFIWGNHDHHDIKKSSLWTSSQPYRELKIGDDFVILFHYGQRVWNRSHHGSIQLYGHSHGTLPGTSQSLDVGVDCWQFHPVALDEIKARLKTLKPYRQEDKHTVGM